MYKPGFIVTFTLLIAMGCGSSATRGVSTAGQIDVEGNDDFAVIVDEAFDAYEQEVREAASATYPSRRAALERAEAVKQESRLLFHIHRALESHGMNVQDLCAFVADHPGFADHQKTLRAPQLARLEDLAESVATAAVEHGDEPMQRLAELDIEEASDRAERWQ